MRYVGFALVAFGGAYLGWGIHDAGHRSGLAACPAAAAARIERDRAFDAWLRSLPDAPDDGIDPIEDSLDRSGARRL